MGRIFFLAREITFFLNPTFLQNLEFLREIYSPLTSASEALRSLSMASRFLEENSNFRHIIFFESNIFSKSWFSSRNLLAIDKRLRGSKAFVNGE